MSKISSYAEQTGPNPASVLPLESPGTPGVSYCVQLDSGIFFIVDRAYMQNTITDFWGIPLMGNERLSPFAVAAITGGTWTQIASEANHPGILEITNTGGANSGANVTLGGLTNVLLGGGEVAEFVFRFPTIASVVVNMGFLDQTTVAGGITDGAVLILSANLIFGRTFSNTVTSGTATNFAAVLGTWYRGKVVLNSNATRVDFYLYDSNGGLLWTDFLTTNIPTGAGRETSFGIFAYKTSAGAVNILDADWAAYSRTGTLTR